MSNFTVSARKYRPGTFESVVGQAHVTQTLKNAIKKNHLGQAFLFCGPRGVGKTTCARILAKALNCEHLTPEGEPCGTCAACQSFQNHQSFNIYELDAASNNSVEDIRSLTEQVRFAPQSGKYKIYIIDEVHMLSQAAFNAFLKTLEEPPSYAIFILATTEKHKIIPTILSRCQVFDFHRISIREAIDHLKRICEKENIQAEEEALYVIAQKADGALRDALSIFDRVVSFSGEKITYQDVIENLNVLDYDYYFRITDLFLDKALPQAMLLFNEILNKGFDGHNFLVGMSEHLRNLLVCKEPSTVQLLELSEGTQSRYMDQARKASLSFLLSGLNILNHFDVNFKSSKNQRLHVELALMKLCHLPDVLSLAKVGDALAEKKKSGPDPRVEAAENIKEKVQAPVNHAVSAPAPVAAPPKKKGLFNRESIREQVKTRLTVEITEEDAPAAETKYERVNEAVFRKAWEGYAQNLKSRGKNSLSTMINQLELEFTSEGGVTIKVHNEALRNQFQDDRIPFIDYINQQHNLYGVRVDYVFEPLTEEATRKYIFSDSDKFKRLVEINPALLDLQQRLGLRI